MKKIILTGGGTAGHVTPNVALFPALREAGYEISYIGSYSGIEKELIEKEGVPYYGISSGKLRRYRSLQNLTDPFRVIKGFFQALGLMRKLKPDVLFSKGGFVAVPVVYAARLCGVRAITHESDLTPGLANKLTAPAATKICCNFPETMQYLPQGKAVLSGCPIRAELLAGDAAVGRKFCGFDDSKPVLMIMGGSIGSVAINNAVRSCLDQLLEQYQIVHLCGKGNVDEGLCDRTGYAQFEYVSRELPDVFAAADLMISRAGANAICELLALHKPSLLIPLSKNASRGDQILNANSFEKQGFAMVLEEEAVTAESLLAAVGQLNDSKSALIQAMESSELKDAISVIMGLIES